MKEEMLFRGRGSILSFEELERIVGLCVRSGVRHVRVTGGEPLTRRGVDGFMQRLGRWVGEEDGLAELTLTTNASRLERYAMQLVEAGVRRVNVSLDSLDEARFRRITRTGELTPVLRGVKAARDAGLAVRVNTVALRGLNDDEYDAMIRWCGEIGADWCVIETMPMGDVGEDREVRYVPLDVVRRDLESRWTLTPLPDRSSGPARYARVEETGRRIGFITPLTHNFCGDCNRMRLSCDGTLYPCLGDEGSVDLRGPLRDGASDEELLGLVRRAIGGKPDGHDFGIGAGMSKARNPARHMSFTGG